MEGTFVPLSVWRDAMIGAIVGMVVCAGMAAGIGVFGGAFLGGWAGVMVGAARLEAAEHELLAHRHA